MAITSLCCSVLANTESGGKKSWLCVSRQRGKHHSLEGAVLDHISGSGRFFCLMAFELL